MNGEKQVDANSSPVLSRFARHKRDCRASGLVHEPIAAQRMGCGNVRKPVIDWPRGAY